MNSVQLLLVLSDSIIDRMKVLLYKQGLSANINKLNKLNNVNLVLLIFLTSSIKLMPDCLDVVQLTQDYSHSSADMTAVRNID